MRVDDVRMGFYRFIIHEIPMEGIRHNICSIRFDNIRNSSI